MLRDAISQLPEKVFWSSFISCAAELFAELAILEISHIKLVYVKFYLLAIHADCDGVSMFSFH